MKSSLISILAALAFAGCADNTKRHVNALTGEACEPDEQTYMPRQNNGNGNQCQGTGPGDNCDDLSSGKIDCIGDGNSGQGDDKKHDCEFPQPGCDEDGCCDDDIVEPPPGDDDPGEPDDPEDPGDDDPVDDGDDAPPPPEDERPPLPDVG